MKKLKSIKFEEIPFGKPYSDGRSFRYVVVDNPYNTKRRTVYFVAQPNFLDTGKALCGILAPKDSFNKFKMNYREKFFNTGFFKEDKENLRE